MNRKRPFFLLSLFITCSTINTAKKSTDIWDEFFTRPTLAKRFLEHELNASLKASPSRDTKHKELLTADSSEIKSLQYTDVLHDHFEQNEWGNFEHNGRELRFILTNNRSYTMAAAADLKYHYIVINTDHTNYLDHSECLRTFIHEIGHVKKEHVFFDHVHHLMCSKNFIVRLIVGYNPPEQCDNQEHNADIYAIEHLKKQ